MTNAFPRRLLAGAALAALALSAVLAVRHHFAPPHRLATGDRLVTLSLSSLSGSDSQIQAAGRPQLINIFTTWCPPCREETPVLARLAVQMQARGIQVTGIDQQESAASVARFAQEFSLPYRVLIDKANVTHDVLGARMIPTTIYVDRSGIIRWQRSGPIDTAAARSLASLVASYE